MSRLKKCFIRLILNQKQLTHSTICFSFNLNISIIYNIFEQWAFVKCIFKFVPSNGMQNTPALIIKD